MSEELYSRQVALLIEVLPLVAEQEIFALKGGTAINLFVRDMPRLSVDIDLTYLPIKDRETSLRGLSKGLELIAKRIKGLIARCTIQKVQGAERDSVRSLIVSTPQAIIKIEANTIIRGTVFPCQTGVLCRSAQEKYGAFVEVKMHSLADMFGGKICAALDRQHLRDLFDIKGLLENEGLTTPVRQAFLVYLAGHGRPMHELLDPPLLDVRQVYENQFRGMSRAAVSYEELEAARTKLIHLIRAGLLKSEKEFLLSIKIGNPDWALLPIPGIEKLPAVQWKIKNILSMSAEKRADQTERLRKCLAL